MGGVGQAVEGAGVSSLIVGRQSVSGGRHIVAGFAGLGLARGQLRADKKTQYGCGLQEGFERRRRAHVAGPFLCLLAPDALCVRDGCKVKLQARGQGST